MKPVRPTTLKRVLESCGYAEVAQDECCWILESNGHPAVIPQTMALVPIDVLESILGPAGITEAAFTALVEKIEAAPHKQAAS